MATSVNLASEGLFYKVRHPEFDPTVAYKAIAYLDYGESAWAQLLFVTHRGMTYAVKVNRCVCVDANRSMRNVLRYRIEDPAVLCIKWPKPVCKNPDLDDD